MKRNIIHYVYYLESDQEKINNQYQYKKLI